MNHAAEADGPFPEQSAPLRILQVIGRLSERFGGPQHYVREVSTGLAGVGHAVTLLGTDSGEPGLRPDEIGLPNVTVRVERGHGGFAIAPRATRAIDRLVGKADVVHIHGMYTYPGSVAARCASRRGTPYIISPHGAANDFHFRMRRWKKVPFEALLQRDELRSASAVVVLSDLERRHAQRNFGLGNVVVVPPSIAIPDRPDEMVAAPIFNAHPELRGKRLVTFMARFSEKKGAPLLVEAFERVAAQVEDAHLVLAGPDDESGIGARTEEMLRGTELGERVTFPGMLRGELKAAVLTGSAVFALPSADESFGIAVAEAMAASVPVVVTPEVALSVEIAEVSAGRVVSRTPAGVAQGILDVLSAPDRLEMGRRGRLLVADRFAADVVTERLESVYRDATAGR